MGTTGGVSPAGGAKPPAAPPAAKPPAPPEVKPVIIDANAGPKLVSSKQWSETIEDLNGPDVGKTTTTTYKLYVYDAPLKDSDVLREDLGGYVDKGLNGRYTAWERIQKDRLMPNPAAASASGAVKILAGKPPKVQSAGSPVPAGKKAAVPPKVDIYRGDPSLQVLPPAAEPYKKPPPKPEEPIELVIKKPRG